MMGEAQSEDLRSTGASTTSPLRAGPAILSSCSTAVWTGWHWETLRKTSSCASGRSYSGVQKWGGMGCTCCSSTYKWICNHNVRSVRGVIPTYGGTTCYYHGRNCSTPYVFRDQEMRKIMALADSGTKEKPFDA